MDEVFTLTFMSSLPSLWHDITKKLIGPNCSQHAYKYSLYAINVVVNRKHYSEASVVFMKPSVQLPSAYENNFYYVSTTSR